MTFTSKIQTTEITAPATIAPYDSDGEPLSATIRTTFTQREAQVIGSTNNATWGQPKEVFAPFIVGWNIDANPPSKGDVRKLGGHGLEGVTTAREC